MKYAKILLCLCISLGTFASAQDPSDNSTKQNIPVSAGTPNGIYVSDTDPTGATRAIQRLLRGSADGQVISWDATNSRWETSTPSAGAVLQYGTGAPTGATPTSPPFYKDTATNQLYCHDGTNWQGPVGNYNFSITDGTTTETIVSGNTITYSGGAILNASVSATDEVTYNFDTTGATSGDVISYNGTTVVWTDGQIHPAASVAGTSNSALSIAAATQVLSLDLDAANSYDNTASGLTADSVQGAIDELAADIPKIAKRTVAVPAATDAVTATVAALGFTPSTVMISMQSNGSEELGINDWHGTLSATGGITVELQGQATAAGTHTLHLLFCE